MRKVIRILVATIVLAVATPLVSPTPPAAADTTLGGYTAVAEAAVVRIGVYEPAIPVPSDPQVDASLGYARANVSTGPTSRALASYLWPGDALGDGLGTLTGNESIDYPVKVTSLYPASAAAPARNTAQITDGNGMTTSADDTRTSAETTGLEVGGNLVSGIASGLCGLLKKKCPDLGIGVQLPLPIATAATMDVAKSTSTVTLGDTVTSTARARASGISLLAGLISIDGVDMDVTATSDGKTGRTNGTLAISGLTIAGKKIVLGHTNDVDGTKVEVPKLPLDLSKLGISVDYLRSTKTVVGPSGKLAAEGLTITVDASVLSKKLKLGVLSELLGPHIGDLPEIGPVLTGLLKLGTKIVITIGDARVSATATPAYDAPPTKGTTPQTSGSVPPAGSGGVSAVAPAAAGSAVPPAALPATQAVASPFQLPGLSKTPSLLVLAALALAGLFGWLFRALGVRFFGVGDCVLGASVGAPNLREG